MVYNKFSEYLLKRYGTKVYKLPVNIPSGCPNRDGICGEGGCIFCGEEGAGFELLPADMSIAEQLAGNALYIGQKYSAEKFIAYFQNYSNTYLPFNLFQQYTEAACIDNAVALYISTRPDCIDDKRVDFLREIKNRKGVDIVFELGLQSVNSRTLRWLNRGHGLAEFADAVQRIKNYGLEVCAHMINDIPADEAEDVVEGAKFLSALGVDQVKCHSLYILEDTPLAAMFRQGGFKTLSMEDFIGRTILFLEYLDPGIVIQRLIGRAPQDRTLFCSWDTSWWKVHAAIEERMQSEGLYQGRLFNYLNGSALTRAGFR